MVNLSKSKQGMVTIDAILRWTHNCYTGNRWDGAAVETCTSGCAVEGADQEYTVQQHWFCTIAGTLELGCMTSGPYSKNTGSRKYYMKDDYAYQLVSGSLSMCRALMTSTSSMSGRPM